MLVLTRKLNQQIHLGNDITVTVLRVKGNTIRLGIDAPRDVRVVRGELEPLDTVARDAPGSAERSSAARVATEAADADPETAADDAPLAGFFPRSVQAAVASVSV